MLTITYSLPAHLDSAVAATLSIELLEHRGKPICIDAGDVAFAGTLPLQVLFAARRQWIEDEQSFQVSPHSPAFATSVRGLGIALPDLGATDLDIAVGEGSA